MSQTTVDPRLLNARAAPRKGTRLSWSDPSFRAIVWQIVILGIVAAIVWFLISNTNRNLEARRIATGFGFLSRIAGIPIGKSLIPYDPATNTYGYALIVGILNTLKVAVLGIVLATILGTVIGIGRLSKNWLIARLTAIYVEVLRDIPVLLQLLFCTLCCRPCRRRANPGGWAIISSCPIAASRFLCCNGNRRTPGLSSPSFLG